MSAAVGFQDQSVATSDGFQDRSLSYGQANELLSIISCYISSVGLHPCLMSSITFSLPCKSHLTCGFPDTALYMIGMKILQINRFVRTL